jgi:hypothetical protein
MCKEWRIQLHNWNLQFLLFNDKEVYQEYFSLSKVRQETNLALKTEHGGQRLAKLRDRNRHISLLSGYMTHGSVSFGFNRRFICANLAAFFTFPIVYALATYKISINSKPGPRIF